MEPNRKKKSGPLSRIDIKELKVITVTIRRHNIPEPRSPQPIIRGIEDAADLVVHIRRGEGQRPIFDRDDIVVNQDNEERVILSSSGDRERAQSSRNRSRSRSRRDKSKTPPERPRRSRSRSYEKYKRRSRSRSTSPTKKSDKYSRERRREVTTPPAPPPRSYRRRSTPLRPGEYRPPKKRSPSPRERKDLKDEAVAGPSRDRYVERSRDRDKRHSRSPLKNRDRSRSPYRRDSRERRRSRSPYKKERRRSRSPAGRYSSRRYSRTPSPLRRQHRSSKRYSRSPPPSYHSQPNMIPTPQYKDGGLWIPDVILQQGYNIPGLFGPPGPRPMIRGPRPMIPPMMHPGLYPPRPPRVYNQPYRPRVTVPAVSSTPAIVSASEANTTTPGTNSATSTSSAADTVTETDHADASEQQQ